MNVLRWGYHLTYSLFLSALLAFPVYVASKVHAGTRLAYGPSAVRTLSGRNVRGQLHKLRALSSLYRVADVGRFSFPMVHR